MAVDKRLRPAYISIPQGGDLPGFAPPGFAPNGTKLVIPRPINFTNHNFQHFEANRVAACVWLGRSHADTGPCVIIGKFHADSRQMHTSIYCVVWRWRRRCQRCPCPGTQLVVYSAGEEVSHGMPWHSVTDQLAAPAGARADTCCTTTVTRSVQLRLAESCQPGRI